MPFNFFNSLHTNSPCVMYCPNSYKPGAKVHRDPLTHVGETGELVFNMCTCELREQRVVSAAHSACTVDEMAEARLGYLDQATLDLDNVFSLRLPGLPRGSGQPERGKEG